MNIPNKFLYTKEHEWADFSGKDVTIGITEFAQSQLGDIVFLEFPEIGDEITQDRSFGEIEAVKTVSELFAPVSGTVTAINEVLEETPEKVNQDCYGEGWLIKIRSKNPTEKDNLLTSAQYIELID
ncbi:MAG: glycine cleavage system protein GcvH [Candidatus Neomarinimicrobiota bacterium]|nr:glycine cleavage system protein GcvH [Candidatus Neomarinimicrobiota bacterium]